GMAAHQPPGPLGPARVVHLGTGRDDGDEVTAGHSGHQGTAPRPVGLPAHRGASVRTGPGPAPPGLRQQRLPRRAGSLRPETPANLPGNLARVAVSGTAAGRFLAV